MRKKKIKSQTLNSSSDTEKNTLVLHGLDSALAETPKPTPPKLTGPTIIFKNLDIQSGGIVTITCADNKVPLNKIQILEIEAGGTKYVYRRI